MISEALHVVPLHKTGSQNSGELGGKDVGQVTDWPLWILFLIVTAALGLVEPSGDQSWCSQAELLEGCLSLRLMAWGNACPCVSPFKTRRVAMTLVSPMSRGVVGFWVPGCCGTPDTHCPGSVTRQLI